MVFAYLVRRRFVAARPVMMRKFPRISDLSKCCLERIIRPHHGLYEALSCGLASYFSCSAIASVISGLFSQRLDVT